MKSTTLSSRRPSGLVITAEDKTNIPDRYLVKNTTELENRLNFTATDIIVMPQERLLDLAPLIGDVRIHERRLQISSDQAKSQVLPELLEAKIRDSTIADEMVHAIKLFAELFGQKQMEVRWDLTDQQSCPKFHCDNVYVRMLVTYLGPTTEFIDQNEGVTYFAPLGALVFLKGHTPDPSRSSPPSLTRDCCRRKAFLPDCQF